MNKHLNAQYTKGLIVIHVLVFAAIAVLMITGLAQWAALQIKATRLDTNRDQAFVIAEAGIEYYRWHLAHNQNDFSDGTCTPGPCAPGPYIHNYFDKDSNHIGTFRLTITPPVSGSTRVTIRSEGRVDTDATIAKIIQVQMGIPSLAKYSYVTDSGVWFGTNEPVIGPLHSNKGIRLDSSANNLVTSALVTTTAGCCWDTHGGTVWAVHTHGNPSSPGTDPAPPSPMPSPIPPLPSRPLIFLAGRQVGVPLVDFNGFLVDMNQLKTLAIANGKYFGASGGSNKGWHLTLRTDGYDVWPVTTTAGMGSCADSGKVTGSPSTNGSWSVGNQGVKQSFSGYPPNGVFFFEDNVWVDGQVQNGRLMITAGRFPDTLATSPHIIVNQNLRYSAFDETDAIGLFAQGDFLIGLKSDTNMEIDAAIIAKNGSTQRHYYSGGGCADKFKTSVTFDGMSASRLQGNAFAWNSPITSGYQNVTFIYDINLLYAPPPNFPRTATAYTTLTWKIVQ